MSKNIFHEVIKALSLYNLGSAFHTARLLFEFSTHTIYSRIFHSCISTLAFLPVLHFSFPYFQSPLLYMYLRHGRGPQRPKFVHFSTFDLNSEDLSDSTHTEYGRWCVLGVDPCHFKGDSGTGNFLYRRLDHQSLRSTLCDCGTLRRYLFHLITQNSTECNGFSSTDAWESLSSADNKLVHLTLNLSLHYLTLHS